MDLGLTVILGVFGKGETSMVQCVRICWVEGGKDCQVVRPLSQTWLVYPEIK